MNGLPDLATSAIGLLVTCAMKPTIEKITNPANILVKEFMQHTMIESLQKKKQRERGFCLQMCYKTSLSDLKAAHHFRWIM